MNFRQVWVLCISFLLLLSIISPQQATASQKGIVTADLLNVRSAPFQDASLLGQLKNGNEVNIINTNGDWLTIQYQSKEAFVHKNFVQIARPTSSRQPVSNSIKIKVNGKQMNLPAEPVNDNGSLLVPFRVLGEALGIQVDWLNSTKQVLAKDSSLDKEVLFTINSEKTIVNEVEIKAKPSPRIVNQSTLLPLRFFSETFGADVVWNESTKEVIITRIKEEPEPITPPNTTEPPIVQVKGIVMADVLNVRQGPSTDAEIIDKVKKGIPLDIIEVNGEWAKVNHKGQQAYVNVNFIKLEEYTVPSTPPKGIVGRKIIIDPGHGGKDPGATKYGIYEKDIILNVGLILRRKLEEVGAIVVMTRSDDTFVELADRVEIANGHKADSFISIHANATTNTVVHGSETYWNQSYFSGESKNLAQQIQNQLIQKLNTNNRGVKEANFYVIRHTYMPSVLVELGFVTNEEEANRMMTPAFQEEAAEAILQGILEFYGVGDLKR